MLALEECLQRRQGAGSHAAHTGHFSGRSAPRAPQQDRGDRVGYRGNLARVARDRRTRDRLPVIGSKQSGVNTDICSLAHDGAVDSTGGGEQAGKLETGLQAQSTGFTGLSEDRQRIHGAGVADALERSAQRDDEVTAQPSQTGVPRRWDERKDGYDGHRVRPTGTIDHHGRRRTEQCPDADNPEHTARAIRLSGCGKSSRQRQRIREARGVREASGGFLRQRSLDSHLNRLRHVWSKLPQNGNCRRQVFAEKFFDA